jgi:hypothetical protein
MGAKGAACFRASTQRSVCKSNNSLFNLHLRAKSSRPVPLGRRQFSFSRLRATCPKNNLKADLAGGFRLVQRCAFLIAAAPDIGRFAGRLWGRQPQRKPRLATSSYGRRIEPFPHGPATSAPAHNQEPFPFRGRSSNHDRGCGRRDAWVGPSFRT